MPLGFLRRLLLSTGHTDLQPEDARAAVREAVALFRMRMAPVTPRVAPALTVSVL